MSLRLTHSFWISLTLTAIALCLSSAWAQSTQKPADDSDPNSTKLGSIKGRVLADGQPVNNASITASRVNSSGPPHYVPVNDAGDFELKGLEPGVYRVSPSAPAYVVPTADTSDETYFRVGDTLALRMIKGGVITGKVLSANDDPVVGIRVGAIMIRDLNGKSPTSVSSYLDRFTDDRGIFRIFGLMPGAYLVSAGGRGSNSSAINTFDHDAPTYAPSSTRDTAAEIQVNSGEEKTVDIHYRGDTGHAVSGNARAPATLNSPWINIYLQRLMDGAPDVRFSTYQGVAAKGFVFQGVADGEYLIWAQYSPANDVFMSEPRRISVKGADITGIDLVTSPVSTVGGEFALEPSTLEACKEKRRPLLDETMVAIQRNQKRGKDQPQILAFGSARAAPDKNGKFLLRNLGSGQYNLEARFFARYWYLKSITGRVAPAGSKETPSSGDLVGNWLAVKAGAQITGVRVTLAEGAASLSGQIEAPKDQTLPPQLVVYLVPTEKEKSDDVLRFFVTRTDAYGSFELEHVPPGRYWLLPKVVPEDELTNNRSLRLPDAVEARARLRRQAESAKSDIDLKPCQNLNDYKLPFRSN